MLDLTPTNLKEVNDMWINEQLAKADRHHELTRGDSVSTKKSDSAQPFRCRASPDQPPVPHPAPPRLTNANPPQTSTKAVARMKTTRATACSFKSNCSPALLLALLASIRAPTPISTYSKNATLSQTP